VVGAAVCGFRAGFDVACVAWGMRGVRADGVHCVGRCGEVGGVLGGGAGNSAWGMGGGCVWAGGVAWQRGAWVRCVVWVRGCGGARRVFGPK